MLHTLGDAKVEASVKTVKAGRVPIASSDKGTQVHSAKWTPGLRELFMRLLTAIRLKALKKKVARGGGNARWGSDLILRQFDARPHRS